MTIHVLTYQKAHKKTYDTLCLLRVRRYNNVVVHATPLLYAKTYKPTIPHRPDMFYNVPDTAKVCEAFGFEYKQIENYDAIEANGEDPILICGAGILPKGFVNSHRIINAHPGYIPYARGLDALKWSLLDNLPVGVSAHFIGDEVDAGEVIERRLVDVYPQDNVLSLGLRVYAEEIDVLVNAIERIDEPHELISGEGSPVHKRMPAELEEIMLKQFEKRKKDLLREIS